MDMNDTPAAGLPRPHLRIPLSTYRLQLHKEFNFADAAALIPYLHELGITDIYTSPFFTAVPGSTHGYDICDYSRINPELGGETGFDTLCDTLKRYGMGLMVDFVPNHMGAHPTANPWWRDVLENGPSSVYARFFDIDWNPVKPELKDKILLPILGDQYGAVLERGELRLGIRDGAFHISYFEHDLPVNPRQITQVLSYRLERLKTSFSPDDPHLLEFLSVDTAVRNLPPYTERDPDKIEQRRREKEICRERLKRVMEASVIIRRHVEENITIFNGRKGEPESFNLLHALLEGQAYRLAYWRTSLDEINYRRFFDINTMVGLLQENEDVFRSVHDLLLRLIHQGKVTGLRIDHIDGLFDPENYLNTLLNHIASKDAAFVWNRNVPDFPTFYVVVEKILTAGESLPPSWPVQGTTGYEFLNDVNGLSIAAENREPLKRLYHRFSKQRTAFEQIVYESKYRIMIDSMVGELNVLTHALNRLSELNRHTRDFTLESIRRTLREVVAAFPLYRTYVKAGKFTEFDTIAIDTALVNTKFRHPTMEFTILQFIRDHLLLQVSEASEAFHRSAVTFAMKFQQYTAPVQAKGVEDTAFYRYHELISLNEVGGDPRRFGCPVSDFHKNNGERLTHYPFALLSTATHDTKRGEDTRMRINVLSEIPLEWSGRVSEWSRLNASSRTSSVRKAVPDRNEEYFIYQTLLGVWPADAESDTVPPDLLTRIEGYLIKAMREAKVHTSWINNNQHHEEGALGFLRKILTPSSPFLVSFVPFLRRIAFHGMLNSLSQTAIKATAPGIPDFYQGCEFWDFTLADPDNRRPVNFNLRRDSFEKMKAVLEEAAPSLQMQSIAGDLLKDWPDGRIKQFITTSLLKVRRENPGLFLQGNYIPFSTEGRKGRHFLAFGREYSGSRLMVMAPLRTVSILGAQTDGSWKPVFEEEDRIMVPQGWENHEYRDIFNKKMVHTEEKTSNLSLKHCVTDFPLSVLLSRPSRQ